MYTPLNNLVRPKIKTVPSIHVWFMVVLVMPIHCQPRVYVYIGNPPPRGIFADVIWGKISKKKVGGKIKGGGGLKVCVCGEYLCVADGWGGGFWVT
jgi:hypothetical protein